MNRIRRNNLLKNLALSVASALVCIVVIEAGLRLMGYGNLEIYEPDPVLLWKLKPNQNCFTKVSHKPVHVNSHGTRSPEFQEAKPASTIQRTMVSTLRPSRPGLSLVP